MVQRVHHEVERPTRVERSPARGAIAEYGSAPDGAPAAEYWVQRTVGAMDALVVPPRASSRRESKPFQRPHRVFSLTFAWSASITGWSRRS
jgi:hypothetical protein